MSEAINKKVLLFGLGAIGGFYAFILGRDPDVSLSVVARSNHDVVKRDGLYIESINHGKHKVRIDHVLKKPEEAQTPFDFVVCTHKALNMGAVPQLFKDVVDENTTFVILQNGVGNEDPFRSYYPRCTIISGVIWVGATQETPGLIKHKTSERTELGLYPNPALDPGLELGRLEQVAQMFRNGGTECTVEENIQVKRWEKVVWNAAWNPITTLTQATTLAWLDSCPEAVAVTRRLWTEMIDVARRCGVPVEYDLIDELLRRIRSMPPIYTSMYTDAKEGRELEIEAILGTPLQKADELAMDVPVLSTVYAMAVAVNERIKSQKKQ